MTFTGHIVNGQVVLDEPVALPDGTPVQIELIEWSAAARSDDKPTVWERYWHIVGKIDVPAPGPTLPERLGDVVGKAAGLPEDGAQNVDHYLYGHPKH